MKTITTTTTTINQEMFLTGFNFDPSIITGLEPNLAFDIDNIISELASEMSSEEGETVIFDNTEYDISDFVIFVDGIINYYFDVSVGDFYTPTQTDREYVDSDLKVYISFNDDDETGFYLSDDQIKKLKNNLK